jgi:hypothetical protein
MMTNPGLGKVEADLKTTGLKLEEMVSRIERKEKEAAVTRAAVSTQVSALQEKARVQQEWRRDVDKQLSDLEKQKGQSDNGAEWLHQPKRIFLDDEDLKAKWDSLMSSVDSIRNKLANVVSKYDKGAEHNTVELLSFWLEMLADWVSGVGLCAPRPQITLPKQHDPIADLLLAYPTTSMVTVTCHWTQHLLDCTTRMLLLSMERFVEESLDDQFSSLPTVAIAAIIKLVNNILQFLFEKNVTTADLHAPAVLGTLHMYAIMKPVTQEAIRCITALAAPWQTDTAGIDDTAGRLEKGLAFLASKAKISEL